MKILSSFPFWLRLTHVIIPFKIIRVAFLFSLLISQYSFSQIETNPEKNKNLKNISGRVMDEAKNPISYASVVAYQLPDSTIISGTASDENGNFNFLLPSGNYFIKITFLSFQEMAISKIIVIDKNIDLGNIFLKSVSNLLQEVEVQAEKSQIQINFDRRVFIVGKDIGNKGGNASEILNNIPSVSVDADGNISLRGSENVRILIDGNPSGLTGVGSTDALRHLSGNMIERVELITNPSSRYDAEGEVGIINIILKKEKKDGLNGTIDATVGVPDNYGISLHSNYRKKYFNIFSGYGITLREQPGKGYGLKEIFYSDTSFSYETVRNHTRTSLSNVFRLGSDIFLNKNNTLTASLLYRFSTGINDVHIIYNDFNTENQIIRTTNRTEDEYEIKNDVEANINYRKVFQKKSSEWITTIKLINNEDTDESALFETYDNIDIIQRSNNTENEQNKLFQTDYISNIGKDGKFETGIKSTFRKIENEYIVEELDKMNNWNVLPDFDNYFIYYENIYASYLLMSNKFNKFSYQTGVRYEYSDITTELKLSDYKNKRSYYNFFPNVLVSYEFIKKQSFQISYSRRLNRPRFRNLLPFFSFSDSRNFFSGNPDLEPEYTHSFESGYLKKMDKGSILSNMYYRYRTGVIERIFIADTNGFTKMFPLNMSKQNVYGFEFNLVYELNKWWRMNGSFNIFRAVSEGMYQNQLLQSDTYAFTGKAFSKINLFSNMDFQFSLNYEGPKKSTQGIIKSMYSLDMGASKDIFKGNGTVSINAKDLLNTNKRRSTLNGENFNSEIEFQWHSRAILLTFSYRVNQKKKSPESKKRDDFNEGDYGGEF